jgi:hypothetical protein
MRNLIFNNNLRFYGHCGEDNLFTISCLYYCNKIASAKEAYYNYCQSNPFSVGNNDDQEAAKERIEGVFFVAKETLDFIDSKFRGDKKVHKQTLLFLEKSLLGRIKNKGPYLNRINKIFGLFFIIRYVLKKVSKVFYRNYVNRFGYHKIKILYIPVYSKKVSL